MGQHLGERVSGLAGMSLLILGITAAAVATIAVAALAYAGLGLAALGVLAGVGAMISAPVWLYVIGSVCALPMLIARARSQPPKSTSALFTWAVALGFSYAACAASLCFAINTAWPGTWLTNRRDATADVLGRIESARAAVSAVSADWLELEFISTRRSLIPEAWARGSASDGRGAVRALDTLRLERVSDAMGNPKSIPILRGEQWIEFERAGRIMRIERASGTRLGEWLSGLLGAREAATVDAVLDEARARAERDWTEAGLRLESEIAGIAPPTLWDFHLYVASLILPNSQSNDVVERGSGGRWMRVVILIPVFAVGLIGLIEILRGQRAEARGTPSQPTRL